MVGEALAETNIDFKRTNKMKRIDKYILASLLSLGFFVFLFNIETGLRVIGFISFVLFLLFGLFHMALFYPFFVIIWFIDDKVEKWVIVDKLKEKSLILEKVFRGICVLPFLFVAYIVWPIVSVILMQDISDIATAISFFEAINKIPK